MTTPEFRCLQLPDVALREVLKNMDLTELLILSLCSQKTNRVVKLNHNKSLEWTLWFCEYRSEPSIGFQCDAPLRTAIVVKEATEFVHIEKYTPEEQKLATHRNGLFASLIGSGARFAPNSSMEEMENATKLDELEKVKIGGQNMPISKGDGPFQVYCTDPKDGFNTIRDYVKDLFGDAPIIVSAEPHLLWFLESIEKRVKKAFISSEYTADLEGVPLTEEEARYVLAKCDAHEINLSAVFPESFNYTGSFLNYHTISIHYGSWVNSGNLISFGESCVDLYITYSKVTNEDINKFIKHWFNGNMYGFRRLIIEYEPVNEDAILADLKDEMIPVDGIMVFRCELYRENIDFPPDSNVLQRKDGKVLATAITTGTKNTVICVWNDIKSSQKYQAGFSSFPLAPFHNVV
uniref:F-box domain-containing protein n=1 Tax=Caenorhabditis tropicalis TaxID=1561998 RepID=A0A1I7TQ33_9PELO